MPIATPHIDLVTVLQLVAARLATIAGVTVENLGAAPVEAGQSALVLRVREMDVTYPARRMSDEGDEAIVVLTFSASCPPDAEAGGILGMAKMLNAAKQLLDREDLVDGSGVTRIRCTVGGCAIVDKAEPGGDNAAHGAVAGAIRVECFVQRTSGTTLTTP